MQKFQITSDVRQKLNKIRSGNVFDSPTVFVTEMLQNSYRAGAKNVTVRIEGDKFSISDDGVGCKTPKPVLTLDYSEWTSTDEGFGIGFWSILAVPELSRVSIFSKTWRADVDIESMFATGTPEANIFDNPNLDGFKVILVSNWFNENMYSVAQEVRNVGETQPFNIYMNGVLVQKKNIINDVSGYYTKTFTTPYFSGKLAITERSYESPTLYYERRQVARLNDNWGVTGIVEMTPKSLNLKEPDRKSIVKNTKYDRFVKTVKNATKELYVEFLQVADEESVNTYAKTIDSILSVDDYEKYITVDDDSTHEDTTELVDSDEPTAPSVGTLVAGATADAYIAPTQSVTSNVIPATMIALISNHNSKKKTLKESVKETKKKVWMRANEIENLSELRAKAEYYGIKVYVANNILQERVFEKNRVPHIIELREGVTKTNKIEDVYLKNHKEVAFALLMQQILNKYNLPTGTIKIGNLKLIVETRLDGKLIDKETKPVAGLHYNKTIYLDRKHLGLKRFHLYGSGVGQNELKAIMANLTTIAHELAHLLYGTTDNTTMHYKSEEQIRSEIVELFINL